MWKTIERNLNLAAICMHMPFHFQQGAPLLYSRWAHSCECMIGIILFASFSFNNEDFLFTSHMAMQSASYAICRIIRYQYMFAESAPLLNSASCPLVCVPWILIRVPYNNELYGIHVHKYTHAHAYYKSCTHYGPVKDTLQLCTP